MDQQTKIGFSGVDNGISAFMKKMQVDSKRMFDDQLNSARKYSSEIKDQIKFIELQIKALERKNKVERESLIKRAEGFQKSPHAEVRYGEAPAAFAKAERISREGDSQVGTLRSVLAELQSQKNAPLNPATAKQVFGAVMAAGLFRDVIGLVRQGSHAMSGLDLVSPVSSILGGTAGGLTGSGIDAIAGMQIAGFGAGKTNFGILMSQMGKEIGGIAGDLVTRQFKIQEAYDKEFLKYGALGGRDASANLASLGYDDVAVAGAMGIATNAAGTGRGAGNSSQLMLALSRLGWSNEGDIAGALGMQRSGGGNGAQNVQRVLGVAFSEGLDRAKFSDVVRTQTALLQHFAQSSTGVSSIDANRTLFEFNRMGGMFSAGDPRSLGNIMSIDQGLTSPSTPFSQAMSYSVLRRLNPSADVWQLRKMQEKGLQTPGFLSGMMDQFSSFGVSESLQKMMIADRFNLKGDAVDTLFTNKGKLGSMSPEELSKMTGLEDIKTEAAKYTNQLTKDTAEVTNAFRVGFGEGINVLAVQFNDRFKEAIIASAIEFKRAFGVGEFSSTKNEPAAVVSHRAQKQGAFDAKLKSASGSSFVVGDMGAQPYGDVR